MSGAYGPLICCRCDKPIEGEPVVVPAFSSSGVRPNQHRHRDGECPTRRLVQRRADGQFIGRVDMPPVAP